MANLKGYIGLFFHKPIEIRGGKKWASRCWVKEDLGAFLTLGFETEGKGFESGAKGIDEQFGEITVPRDQFRYRESDQESEKVKSRTKEPEDPSGQKPLF